MGVWQGVAMDSLKFQLGLLCPTPLCPDGRPPLKRPYGGRPAAFTLLETPRYTSMMDTPTRAWRAQVKL
jgi:hypothetical protein